MRMKDIKQLNKNVHKSVINKNESSRYDTTITEQYVSEYNLTSDVDKKILHDECNAFGERIELEMDLF